MELNHLKSIVVKFWVEMKLLFYIAANNVNADNAFQFLQVASSFGGVESLQVLLSLFFDAKKTACAHFISKNFLELLHDKSQAIFKLDPFTFKKMIESEDLRIKTERDVFEAVLKYVAQFSGSVLFTPIYIYPIIEERRGSFPIIACCSLESFANEIFSRSCGKSSNVEGKSSLKESPSPDL